MKIIVNKVACLLGLVAAAAGMSAAQSSGTTTATAPVAYVYVQTTKGVLLYDAWASGRLTPVAGSPFKTVGTMVGSNRRYFLSLGTTYIHSYPVAGNGTIGAQVAQINTALYSGGLCGGTHGGVLDHTGQFVEILFEPTIYVSSPCTAYQTYRIGKTTGALTFLGDAVVNPDVSGVLGPLAQTQNDQFGYAFDVNNAIEVSYAGFRRESNGALANWSFAETDPQPPDPYSFFSWLVTEDPANHLAIALGSLEYFGSPLVQVGPTRLASYTVDASGNISSTNTWETMPVPAVGPSLLKMSPGGTLLAVGGDNANCCPVQSRRRGTVCRCFTSTGPGRSRRIRGC